jgi:hypothetical protein
MTEMQIWLAICLAGLIVALAIWRYTRIKARVKHRKTEVEVELSGK